MRPRSLFRHDALHWREPAIANVVVVGLGGDMYGAVAAIRMEVPKKGIELVLPVAAAHRQPVLHSHCQKLIISTFHTTLVNDKYHIPNWLKRQQSVFTADDIW